MPKIARYHIDRAEIIVLPRKVATTVCLACVYRRYSRRSAREKVRELDA